MKKTINEVCELINGYAFKSSKYVDKGIRVIRITNVQKGIIEDLSPKYYPLDTENKIKKYILKENDLLISLTGNVGRVGLLTKELLPAALNQRVACLRIRDNNIDIKYLFQMLNSNKFEQDCINNSNGVAQKNLSTDWIKKYEIDVPKLNIQKERIKKLETILKIICNKKKELDYLDIMVKSQFVENLFVNELEVA